MAFRYIGFNMMRARAIGALVKANDDSADKFVEVAGDAAPHLGGALEEGIESDGTKLSGNSVSARVHTGGAAAAYDEVQERGYWIGGPLAGVQIHAGNPGFMEEALIDHTPEHRSALRTAVKEAF